MKSIGHVLQPYVDSQTLAGAVILVAGPDKIYTQETVGYADVSAKTPMRPDSLFWIASVSKPLTGAALMFLVDEGKLRIDDPVDKYIPAFKGQWLATEKDDNHILLHKVAGRMTIEHLLSHTSGLPFMSRLEGKIDRLPLREAVISYAMTPLNSEPGTKYDYSNAGINTAGRIIEIVSGQSYTDFLDERLFRPLGMTDTTIWPNAKQMSRLAKSYKPNAANNGLEEIEIGQLSAPFTNPDRYPCPGGGYFSTAKDMAVFGQMVMNGGMHQGKRLLSEEAVKVMTSRHTGSLEANYGLGWSISLPPTPGFGHGGAYNNHLWIHSDQQLVTVWMVQHAGYPGPDGPKISQAFTDAAKVAFGKKTV